MVNINVREHSAEGLLQTLNPQQSSCTSGVIQSLAQVGIIRESQHDWQHSHVNMSSNRRQCCSGQTHVIAQAYHDETVSVSS